MGKHKDYEIAIGMRNMEIQMFWQRSNYFLILNTAIAAGYFTLKSNAVEVGFSAMGCITSFLWFMVCLGGKYWQSRWEERAKIIENGLNIDMKLLSADKYITDRDVKSSFEWKHDMLGTNNSNGTQLSLLEKAIMTKPSVSRMMTWLSIVFTWFWSLLFGAKISPILKQIYLWIYIAIKY